MLIPALYFKLIYFLFAHLFKNLWHFVSFTPKIFALIADRANRYWFKRHNRHYNIKLPRNSNNIPLIAQAFPDNAVPEPFSFSLSIYLSPGSSQAARSISWRFGARSACSSAARMHIREESDLLLVATYMQSRKRRRRPPSLSWIRAYIYTFVPPSRAQLSRRTSTTSGILPYR